MKPKTNYTRDELIALCERGVVTYDKAMNRDWMSAQEQLHIAKLALMGDCEFKIRIGDSDTGTDTDDWTIWVDIYYSEFETPRWNIHYIPTEKRLAEANGGDWY